MAKARTVASHLADALPELGITHVFELVGGMVTVLIDAMHENPLLTVVSTHHEQGAGFAAEGYARFSGRPAVALATSGPGATNLLTAIGSCYFDSIPVIFITGQVNRHEFKQEGRGRQGGFQETDIVTMAKPVTKWATMVTDPALFAGTLEQAVRIATSGRPGPVLLDIPMDVQRATIDEPVQSNTEVAPPTSSDEDVAAFLHELGTALKASERPLVLAGGGIRAAGAVKAFRAFAEHLGSPVGVSLMGVDAIPTTSPLRAGLFGSYGNRWANWAIGASDLLLVLGSRLDVRQTGSDVEGFRSARRVFHIDVDGGELNNKVLGCDVLHEDLRRFLPMARAALGESSGRREQWLNDIAERRRTWPDTSENVPASGINPNAAVRQISGRWADVGAIVTDVGQHQMWAAQSAQIGESQRFLTSGGMGSMGFGLPAAVGAALAADGVPVALIAGDGGLQCNIQELQTLARLKLPVRVVVFDNGCHGMVRQFQESYFDGRYYSTRWGYSAPDFCAVAEAYGIPSWHADSPEQFAAALDAIRDAAPGPSLLHVKIDEDLNVYPKMAFGQVFGSMEPDVAPTEMEGT